MSADRPADDADVSIEHALRWQARYCLSAGSPVASLMLEAVLADLCGDRRLAEHLPERVRFGTLPGLRIMAAVHLLALERRAPAVGLHLPTLGGTPPRADPASRDAFSSDVVSALVDHADVLSASMASTPSTNETGRAALLRCALSRLEVPSPVRLREIGASAGLNLRADHLPGLQGLEIGPLPQVVDRVGCDLDPIDPTTQAGRMRLSSYVWVDDVERFERLGRAMDVARAVPASIVRADGADFVRSLDLEAGTTTVIWHSAMWVYLRPPTRQAILDAIDALSVRATPSARLAHVSWEWRADGGEPGEPFELVLRQWAGAPDDGRPTLLARGISHGTAATLVGEDAPESMPARSQAAAHAIQAPHEDDVG
ncbi:MAG: DUF2332 family protein [Actinobacteria bacterium]|uniref:Unannotated protein n=1 Tax=freshwater metagenome TaxID=449393 RepID=A0A6J7CU38_9ZZZZ|nr:DUF2332 family protein [Actinomycetota bacterium]